MNTQPRLSPLGGWLLAAWLAWAAFPASGQNSGEPAAPSLSTTTQDVVRGYLQVQEQLHSMQMSLERNQQDAQDIAARNVKALGERLNAIEQSIGTQRVSELKAMRDSNRLMLVITATLAVLGLVVVLFGFLQWRAPAHRGGHQSANPAANRRAHGGAHGCLRAAAARRH
jgi:TolA-binding protein